MISSSGPVYMTTEQPKREKTDFGLQSDKDVAANFKLISEKDVVAEDEKSKASKGSKATEESEEKEESESSEEE